MPDTMTVKITFTEPLLGTLPANPNIAKEFILSRFPGEGLAEDEEQALSDPNEEFEKGITVFARDAEKRPMLWDYQIKGFFKDACLAMIESGELTLESLKKDRLGLYTYKREIDNLIFATPRRIVIALPDTVDWPGWDQLPEGPMGLRLLQRPLRKENPRGGTVCLATSEAIPPDATMEFSVTCLNEKLMPYVVRWLNYGTWKGMGQWRNASYGRFEWSQSQG